MHPVPDTAAPRRLADHLLCLVTSVAASLALPAVRRIYLPPAQEHGEKSRKFGLVVLDDESTGFFYTLLGDDAAQARSLVAEAPRDVLALARWFADADGARRGIGLGAISAVSQALFRAAGFIPPPARNPLADLEPGGDDHIGMVGYFPSLVRHLRENRIPLTVLELDQALVQRLGHFEVTLDPARLHRCNKIVCTASTLINDTVDEVLAAVRHAEFAALIGPSADCLPEPLFARGLSLVGGSSVIDFTHMQAACESGADWGDSVRKYCLTPASYPGTEALLRRVEDRGA